MVPGLPQDVMDRLSRNGAKLVVESVEDGILVHTVRPDIRRAYIEVTTRCNLDCAMCMRRVWRDAPGEMTWKTFQTVLEELRPLAQAGSLQRIVYGGFGEPLSHPRILGMLAATSTLGIGITLTTNATLLDRQMAEALIAARVDTIVVSLDTMHAEAFERAQAADSWQTVLDNVRSLSDLRRSKGLMVPRLAFEVVATRHNSADLPRVMVLAKDMGAAFVIVSNLLPYTQDATRDILYDRDEPLPMPIGWPVVSGDYVQWGTARLPHMKWGAARRCQFVEDRAVVIGWDGAVSPCYALLHSYPYYIYGREKNVARYTLGNVCSTSLADIWASREYVVFRSKVRGFRFTSCVDCGMACSFARDNSDCWGNSPSCADCLWAQDIVRCP